MYASGATRDGVAGKSLERNFARHWADICAASPELRCARALTDDASTILASWTVRDVVAAKKRPFSSTYFRVCEPGAETRYVASPPSPPALHEEFVSPSGRMLVRFSEKTGVETEVEVEVWSIQTGVGCGSVLEASWVVPATTHGSVFADEWFGGVAWSPNENLLIYVADRPRVAPPESGSAGSSATSSAKPTADTWMNSLRLKYDQTSRDVLGEAFINRRSPALFLADVARAESRPMCLPDEDNPDFEGKDIYGEPQWSPDGKWVAAARRPTALTHPSLEVDGLADNPYDLGVKYCYNRYSSIELFPAPESLEDAATVLKGMCPVTNHFDIHDFCCTSPRFSPDSKFLVYLSAPRKEEGRARSVCLPHATTKVLRGVAISGDCQEASASPPVTIVDVVQTALRDEFPGLYLHALPERPWLGQGASLSIVATSTWGSETRCLRIPVGDSLAEVRGSEVVDITPLVSSAGNTMCLSVLDVCPSGWAVLCLSSCVFPQQVVVSDLLRPKSSAIFVSQPCQQAKQMAKLVLPFESVDLALAPTPGGGIDASVPAQVFRPGVDKPSQRYQVTLLIPATVERTGRVPLVVFPHGGPHTNSLNSFNRSIAAMIAANLAVLQVNYRGSQGFGQSCLESLPGFAGTQDVSEVLQATQWALQSHESLLDKSRVGYAGGSHGGFLGAHCSVVPGNPFKRLALRNPVCNVSSMVNVSDIPEWAFCEAGVPALGTQSGLALNADPAALAKMWCASPVARVSKNGTPPGKTLLLVGAGDRRVPPQQSLEWQRIITEAHGAGIVTLRWYADTGHAIDEVPRGDDAWVHTLELFSGM